MATTLSGLASGFDWQAVVDQLTEVERAPQARLTTEQTKIQQRNNAYGSIKTQLGVLNNRIAALKDGSLFGARTTAAGDSTIASATAGAGAALGTYSFNFTQLATAAVQRGTVAAGKAIAATNDVSGVVLSNAGFTTAISAGNITVNGKQVAIATTDTLQQVFDKISTATGGTVTGSYNSSTDKIELASGGPIVLGSATDTSNFLQVAKLYNNGTGAIASANELGGVRLGGTISASNLTTTVTDGGAGAGSFKINGVSISFNAATESISTVLSRINNSTAGVTASYDAINDRFAIANKATGDVGIAMEDVTGNFLAATGLSGGALERGKNLLYSVNGGGQLVSSSNTISEASSGLPGLAVTALKENATTTISVNSDATKIKTALNDFISEYNKTQSLIDSQTASTTDSKGKVTAGILSSERDADEIASTLRGLVNTRVTSLGGLIKGFEDLGIVSNGEDNTIKLGDSTKLDNALANNLNDVKNIFTDSTSGLAVKLSAFMDKTVGDSGSLLTKQTNLTKQSDGIDEQIASMERRVQANKARLTASFVAMETAQAKITQQASFLSKISTG